MCNFEIALRNLQISQSKSVYRGETEGFTLKLMVLADSPRLALKVQQPAWLKCLEQTVNLVSSVEIPVTITCKGTPPTKAKGLLVPPSFLTSYSIVPPDTPLALVVGWL